MATATMQNNFWDRYGGQRRPTTPRPTTTPTTPTARPAVQPNPTTGNPLNNTGAILEKDPNQLYGQYNIDPKGDNAFRDIWRRMGVGLFPGMASSVGFYNQLQPQNQQAIQQLIRSMSGGNMMAQGEAFRRQAMGNATSSARVQDSMLRGMGLGEGARSGAAQNAINQATTQANQFNAMLQSPQGRLQALQAIMSAIGMGQDQAVANTNLMAAWTNNMLPSEQYKNSQKGSGSIFNGMGGMLGQLAGSMMTPGMGGARPGTPPVNPYGGGASSWLQGFGPRGG